MREEVNSAHPFFHFGLGMVAGSLLALKPLIGRWYHRRRLSPAFVWWFALSYGLGVFAVFPGLLRLVGVPDVICDGWWMNIFLLHPTLNQLRPGGMLIGEFLIVGIFAMQYLSMVVLGTRRH